LCPSGVLNLDLLDMLEAGKSFEIQQEAAELEEAPFKTRLTGMNLRSLVNDLTSGATAMVSREDCWASF
jgi:hypothetical protein